MRHILSPFAGAAAVALVVSVATSSLVAQSLVGPAYIDIRQPTSPYIPPDNVTGSRFLWLPTKNALRFGGSSSNWNYSSIGYGSFAGGGTGPQASGTGAFAFGVGEAAYGGWSTSASGDFSIAFNGNASGNHSIAMGWGSQAGAESVAMGVNASGGSETVVIGARAYMEATSMYSGTPGVVIGANAYSVVGDAVVIGYCAVNANRGVAIGNFANSDGGTAVGAEAAAYGLYGSATAMGQYANAQGDGATVLGASAGAGADKGVAIGHEAWTVARGGIALGASPSIWRKDGTTVPVSNAPHADDPILAVGNGSGNGVNGLTMYRDGLLRLTGPLQLPVASPTISFYNAASPHAITGQITFPTTGSVSVVTSDASGATKLVGAGRKLVVGGTATPDASWQSPLVLGPDGGSKVVTGYLGGSTNGAVVGARNSALTGWADLNLSGSNLIFRSSETERMRMTSAGNVGIGTSSPGAKLHVSSTGSSSERGFRITATGTGADHFAEAQFAASGREYRIGAGGTGAALGLDNKFYVWDSTANTARVALDTNGNFGVGTTTPAAKLDVNGTVRVSGDVTIKSRKVIRVSPAGDLGMGSFMSGTDPEL